MVDGFTKMIYCFLLRLRPLLLYISTSNCFLYSSLLSIEIYP